MSKSRGQLISKLQHMKQGNNNNAIKHIKYEDIDDICNYLLEDKHEIDRLEKALDKAVEDIECYDCSCWDDSTNERCKKCLKERCMKND